MNGAAVLGKEYLSSAALRETGGQGGKFSEMVGRSG
jgi:hypothetical protein